MPDAILEARQSRNTTNSLTAPECNDCPCVSHRRLRELVCRDASQIVPRVAAVAMKRSQIKRAAFRTISQIGIQYGESTLSKTLGNVPESAPHAGDRFPWLRLRFQAQGPREDLFQRLDDNRFNLFVIGRPAPSSMSLQFGDMPQVHAVLSDIENERGVAAASIPNPRISSYGPTATSGSRVRSSRRPT